MSVRTRSIKLLGLMIAVSAIALSINQPSKLDTWQYAKWFVESTILQTGHLPSCDVVSSTGTYQTAWAGKICTRINAPISPMLTTIATLSSGIDFTGEARRLFLITPIIKAFSGYLIVSLYTSRSDYQYFGAVLFVLIPDYSVYYLSQAKGISLPLVWLAVYTLLRWKQSGGVWIVFTHLFLLTISLFYLPRAIILVSVIFVFTLAKSYKNALLGVSSLSISILVLYATQANLTLENIQLLFQRILSQNLSISSLLRGTHPAIPYIAPSSGFEWGYLILTPLAILGLLGTLCLLNHKGYSIFADERALWSYGIAIAYFPASLLLPFFRTRMFFELAAPATVVGISGVSALKKAKIESVSISAIVLCSILVLAGLAGAMGSADSYGPAYNDLGNSLQEAGIGANERVFTDFKTGALLVGENRYKEVNRIINGSNSEKIQSIWYSNDAHESCNRIKSDYSSKYFILNSDIKDTILIENYRRQSVRGESFSKYSKSSHFNRIFSKGEVEVYRLKC